jgi:hypothetical protein
MASQSEQLERETDQTRARLSATLDELRARMTPGEVVDRAIEYANEGPAAEFLRNLGREIRENPMPLVVIGIGVAWLMVASSRSARTMIAETSDSTARKSAEIRAAISGAVNTASEWAQQTAALAVERVSDRVAAATLPADAGGPLAAEPELSSAAEAVRNETDRQGLAPESLSLGDVGLPPETSLEHTRAAEPSHDRRRPA